MVILQQSERPAVSPILRSRWLLLWQPVTIITYMVVAEMVGVDNVWRFFVICSFFALFCVHLSWLARFERSKQLAYIRNRIFLTFAAMFTVFAAIYLVVALAVLF